MKLIFVFVAFTAGVLADHHPLHDDYGLPKSDIGNFNEPAYSYEIPAIVAPVLPSFVEVTNKKPSTSYIVPEKPVKKINPPPLIHSQPPKTIEITDSGEIHTDLFDLFNVEEGHKEPLLVYHPPTTTRKPYTKPSLVYTAPNKPVTDYYVPSTSKPFDVYEVPIKPFEVYEAPTTTTTTRKPTTTTTTTTTTPKPTTTTTTTTTTTPKPTTTTTTTTTTTPKPTTTTEKVVYGPPHEKPPKPFDDYGPPTYSAKPFAVTERPSYPYPPAGIPVFKPHHGHHSHIVPHFIRILPNPYFRLTRAHFIPVHNVPNFTFFK